MRIAQDNSAWSSRRNTSELINFTGRYVNILYNAINVRKQVRPLKLLYQTIPSENNLSFFISKQQLDLDFAGPQDLLWSKKDYHMICIDCFSRFLFLKITSNTPINTVNYFVREYILFTTCQIQEATEDGFTVEDLPLKKEIRRFRARIRNTRQK